MTVCKLCQNNPELVDSHIIPDFVGRWIKNTSGTGKLRNPETINKRVQDLVKCKLLCSECESIFQKYEDYFSKNIFKPFLMSYLPEFQYDNRLLKFIVSLSWRILVYSMPDIRWKTEKHKIQAEQAEKVWRDFLFEDKNFDDYEHNLLLLRFVQGSPIISGTTVDINWYFFRSVDGTIAQNADEAFTYVKIPGFVFISPLREGSFEHLKNTKINSNGTVDFNSQNIDDLIYNYFDQRSNEALSNFRKLSSNQLDKIESSYMNNLDNIENSYFYQMEMARQKWHNKNKQ